MRFPPPLLPAIAMVVSFAVLPPPAISCPLSAVDCAGSVDMVADPVFERICSKEPRTVVAQDAVAGKLRVEKSGPGDDGADVFATDEYVIRGAVPGEINLTARLVLTGWLDCPLGENFEHGSAYVVAGFNMGTKTGDALVIQPNEGSGFYTIPSGSNVRFDLNVEPDQPFQLTPYLVGIASRTGGLSCAVQLGFEELPAGAWIESCKGFRQPTAVPALAVSWGRVKVAYR